MGLARSTQINLSDTPYYHCISRCVRHAYLCGVDRLTGQSYEHRRGWVEQRLMQLAKVFCIDVAAYAVMSNHTHLVLFIDAKKANRLSDKAILIRWHKLFKGTLLTQRFLNNDALDEAELDTIANITNIYRQRLQSISWFMRTLNEDIARRANKEDDCTGRFWEGRFKSQALLDEAALVACLAYVDLNPIRAKAATLPENSDYTSIKVRVDEAKKGKQPKSLMRFTGGTSKSMPTGLPFELASYLELIDLTGRCIRDDKPGYINHSEKPILERLNIAPENWLKLTTTFNRSFHRAVGTEQSLTEHCERHGKLRRAGLANSQRLFA